MRTFPRLVVCVFALFLAEPGKAADQALNGRTFTLPDGYRLELAAGQPLVERPITAAFDEAGRLYVADSSGSNDNVQQQLKEKPHRILRLDDSDGDGQFDTSHVFADRMMFPEGTLWHAGSLYVSAPPSIWKLTDTDGDGVADKREEWFQGKTLTGCANDLHGPYLGRDGWIYWCKGAFAEQTYDLPGKGAWTTRAAHIFRRRPSGGPVEPVMAGGMDNPVDVVFTPGGERIFTTTFMQHPRGGQRDGLIHAIYGGLYGKVHGVIDDHPRTGELMPPMVHLGAAAPAGLAMTESTELGDGFQHSLFAALFNMQKVTRHVLTDSGATYTATTQDFVSSAEIDFHPTDVLEDADGSLLIVDTGGWYKLCCPTSQLYKPDVLGAIYRLRRVGGHQVEDPRGMALSWDRPSAAQIVSRLGDSRPAVRDRALLAVSLLAEAAESAAVAVVKELERTLSSDPDPRLRLACVWALARIDNPPAHAAVRKALVDSDPNTRQAAAHVAGLRRDTRAFDALIDTLRDPDPQVQRAAAEALGRLADPRAIPSLMTTRSADDRILEHSLTYALIEIDRPEATRDFLTGTNPRTRRRAYIAVDQMPSGGVAADEIRSLLDSPQVDLRETAWWLVERHPEWADELAPYFQQLLAGPVSADVLEVLRNQLPRLLHDAELQRALVDPLAEGVTEDSLKQAVIESLADSGQQSWPPQWRPLLSDLLSSQNPRLVDTVVDCLYRLDRTVPGQAVARQLESFVSDDRFTQRTRLQALAVVARRREPLAAPLVQAVCQLLQSDQPPAERGLAVDILTAVPLRDRALETVIEVLPSIGTMELSHVLDLFHQSSDERVGVRLVEALEQTPAAAAIPTDVLAAAVQHFGGSVPGKMERLIAEIESASGDRLSQLEEVLELIEDADIRRGQAIFNSSKASCRACHEMGYLGGEVGPDLTRIGRIRTERDLLESILFPSASFVRSYEPVEILTSSGKVFLGVVRDESAQEVTLAVDAQKVIRVARDEIELRRPGKVSVMPAGLEKQLTSQDLADLVKFLRASQ